MRHTAAYGRTHLADERACGIASFTSSRSDFFSCLVAMGPHAGRSQIQWALMMRANPFAGRSGPCQQQVAQPMTNQRTPTTHIRTSKAPNARPMRRRSPNTSLLLASALVMTVVMGAALMADRRGWLWAAAAAGAAAGGGLVSTILISFSMSSDPDNVDSYYP